MCSPETRVSPSLTMRKAGCSVKNWPNIRAACAVQTISAPGQRSSTSLSVAAWSGSMRAPADVAALFDALESAVGLERAREMHIHFSHIEYGRGGEVRHLTFAETAFGPDFAPVARELAARGYAARVICESAGTQAEDALTMQREYLESMPSSSARSPASFGTG